jgi:hypothetical protein
MESNLHGDTEGLHAHSLTVAHMMSILQTESLLSVYRHAKFNHWMPKQQPRAILRVSRLVIVAVARLTKLSECWSVRPTMRAKK